MKAICVFAGIMFAWAMILATYIGVMCWIDDWSRRREQARRDTLREMGFEADE